MDQIKEGLERQYGEFQEVRKLPDDKELIIAKGEDSYTLLKLEPDQDGAYLSRKTGLTLDQAEHMMERAYEKELTLTVSPQIKPEIKPEMEQGLSR